MSETIHTMISEETIRARVKELGAQITTEYKDRPLV